jgi:hypothetical protein
MSRKLASFRDYDDKLFDLYTRCRYNELICAELMSGAVRLEKWNQWMLFGSIVGSLLAGALGFLNAPSFAWAWASFGALATGLSLYSLIVDAGGRRFCGSAWPASSWQLPRRLNNSRYSSSAGKLRSKSCFPSGGPFQRSLRIWSSKADMLCVSMKHNMTTACERG